MLIIIKVFGKILISRPVAIISFYREKSFPCRFRDIVNRLVFDGIAISVGGCGSPFEKSRLTNLELEGRESITTAEVDIRCFGREPIDAFDALGDLGWTVHTLDPLSDHHCTRSEKQDGDRECEESEELHSGV